MYIATCNINCKYNEINNEINNVQEEHSVLMAGPWSNDHYEVGFEFRDQSSAIPIVIS